MRVFEWKTIKDLKSFLRSTGKAAIILVKTRIDYLIIVIVGPLISIRLLLSCIRWLVIRLSDLCRLLISLIGVHFAIIKELII